MDTESAAGEAAARRDHYAGSEVGSPLGRGYAVFSPNTEILSFPVVENADFAVTFTGTEALRGRMRALSALLEGKAVVVLATASEAAQLLPAPEKLLAEKLSVRLGDVLERENLLAQLTERGYERVDQVERCGHFAVRGDIIDIFPINEFHPYRVEFFDDEVDGIRQFDEDTQRSIASAEAFLCSLSMRIRLKRTASFPMRGKDLLFSTNRSAARKN